ncbi:MAG: L,D-transpeptidase family protein, partial [Ghiorsea sp.]
LGEATVRLQAFADKVDGVAGYPLDLLLLRDDVQSVFLVDKVRSRMFVYQRDQSGEMQRVADEYIVTGAKTGDKQQRGDARTPNGIYRFTEVRHDANLTAKYGPVVFPIDYPNSLDQLHGKSGDGIWMHGYPESVSRRQPQDTRGCFALPNAQLEQMEKFVVPGNSWVIIGDNFVFNQQDQQLALLQSVQKSLKAWQEDWQSLDAKAYLKHYHADFLSGKYNLKRWKSYKTRVNRHKQFIRVSFSQLNILRDPTKRSEGEVVVVDFMQDYQSSNYQDAGQKRLYLARKNNNEPWKILIEESLNP